MSAFLAIFCDKCSEPEMVTMPAAKAGGPLSVHIKQLRDKAKERGWSSEKGKDICKICLDAEAGIQGPCAWCKKITKTRDAAGHGFACMSCRAVHG